VAVLVSDIDRSLAWYTTALGLDVIEQDGHWVTVGHKGENGALHLCQMTEIDPSVSLEPGNTGIQLDLVGDFRSACAALEANGVRFCRRPLKRPWGWYALIVDPDDNEIRLNPA
jgi:predicted enzyme related to lactoylglutathione lyase